MSSSRNQYVVGHYVHTHVMGAHAHLPAYIPEDPINSYANRFSPHFINGSSICYFARLIYNFIIWELCFAYTAWG